MTDQMVTVIKNDKRKKTGFLLIHLADEYLIWVLLIGSVLIMTSMSKTFFSRYNLINLALSSSVLGIMVIAESLVLIIGKMDLSIESNLAFSALIGAIMVTQGINIFLSIITVLLVGAGIGLVNGIFIVKIGVNPFVQTLSMNIIFRGMIFLISGGIPFYGFPQAYRIFGSTKIANLPTPIIILIILYILFIIIFHRTQWGRQLYAVGQNNNAAYFSGINIGKMNIQVFVLAGLLSAFSGLILSTRLNSMDYNVAKGMIFDIMAAAVIGGISLNGGRGKLLGAIGGVLFLTCVSSILTWLNLSIYWVETTRGFIILFAVILDALKNIFREKIMRD